MKMPRRTVATGALLLAALAASSIPASAQAQEQDLDRERMTLFVCAHVAINDARDEFHGKVARVHDAEGRARAREEVEETIEAILEEHEMTRERYDEVTLLISLDGDLRTMFEEIVAEVEEGTTTC